MTTIIPDGELAVGIQLPVQAQSRIFAERWEADAGIAEIERVARAADDLGFYYVGVCDHVAIPADKTSSMGSVWYDPVATLSYLAAVTSRVRLLTHVYVLGLRPALQAAKSLGTLDAISGGRLILGVGAGHVQAEFEALGAEFGERGQVLDERIDAIRGAFGREDLVVAPQPVQQEVPIWVGGSSGPALRRAAERGDGWIPQGTPRADMPAQIETIRRLRGDRPIDLGAMAEPIYIGEPSWDVGRWTLTGTPEEHAVRLRDFADMGCSHVQVRLRSRSVEELLDQMNLFAEAVLPALKR